MNRQLGTRGCNVVQLLLGTLTKERSALLAFQGLKVSVNVVGVGVEVIRSQTSLEVNFRGIFN